ncbi:MAG TPA: hypothetical protein VH814_16260 [Steroidobacteraceae bacterium]
MPSIALATSVVTALVVWMLGVQRAVPLLVGLLVLAGVALVAYKETRDAFLLAGAFVLPFVIGGGALGVLSGALLKARRFVLGLLPLAPALLFLVHTHSSLKSEEEVKRRGMEFISTEKHMLKLLGQPLQPNVASLSKDRHGSIRRIEYSFAGHPSTYALVDVTGDESSLSFHVACVTSLGLGQREVGKDDCAQAPVALPEVP